ncbi:hypothetical protein RF11_15285 [Thelohanellus kitauei]|uniref:Oral cancer-overexpressed protein 1 n=1 Tax=Thelohanellus kitauei TaxID=669202 RepID=A0A0C2NDG6_THEKT|nr:hypothetical protein RF11_15285 [Thelohanellus kitauei]
MSDMEDLFLVEDKIFEKTYTEYFTRDFSHEFSQQFRSGFKQGVSKGEELGSLVSFMILAKKKHEKAFEAPRFRKMFDEVVDLAKSINFSDFEESVFNEAVKKIRQHVTFISSHFKDLKPYKHQKQESQEQF